VVWRELNTNPTFAVDAHAVPVILGNDVTFEDTCPEAALGSEIGGVEYDDLLLDAHSLTLARFGRAAHARETISE
jgi:hypothetical protein